MYFRITIPAFQEDKKDEAVSFVKEKVMPEFSGTPGLLSLTAAITGDTSGINMAAWDSKEASEAVAEKSKQHLLKLLALCQLHQSFMKVKQCMGKCIKQLLLVRQNQAT